MPIPQHPQEPGQPLLAEKVLSTAFQPHLVTFDSRTDLIALVTEEHNVEVYRLGGQRAFTVRRKTAEAVVERLCWIRGGRFLAVAWSGSPVEILSGENGKFVRHAANTDSRLPADTVSKVTCLGWGLNSVHNEGFAPLPSDGAAQPGHHGEGLTIEQWHDKYRLHQKPDEVVEDLLSSPGQVSTSLPQSLPRQLALVDVEQVLPKLSPIPPRADNVRKGDQHDIFTTQSSLDTYFFSLYNRGSSALDVMIIGHDDGSFYVVLDQIFRMKGKRTNLNVLNITQPTDRLPTYLAHTSHPYLAHHALLRGFKAEDTETRADTYHSLFVDTYIIPKTGSDGSHLDLIMSKTALTRDLGNYALHTAECLQADWKVQRNLPLRFMENVNETLGEKGEGTLEQNLYHLAMTGDYTPTMLEWLRDELAERGHKRWDQAMTTLYTELNKTLQTNFLPVLERLMIVATDLRGLAKFYEGSKRFDVSSGLFEAILDAVGVLRLLVEEAIRWVGEEHRQYRAFSKWLRHQIDIAAAEPGSQSAEEMAEREAMGLEYPRLLAYIEGPLTKSKLEALVTDFTSPLISNASNTAEAIARARKGKLGEADIGQLSILAAMRQLTAACEAASESITQWQSSILTSTDPILLDHGTFTSAYDTRMVCETAASSATFVLAVPTQSVNSVYVYAIPISSSGSRTQTTQGPAVKRVIVTLPSDGEVRDVRIQDDESCLVLYTQGEISHLLRMSLQMDEDHSINSLDEAGTSTVLHMFPHNDGFVPNKMVVNGRKGRMSVCILGQGNRHYKVFDLEQRRQADSGDSMLEEDYMMADPDLQLDRP